MTSHFGCFDCGTRRKVGRNHSDEPLLCSLCRKRRNILKEGRLDSLSTSDWIEIYYALEYKLTLYGDQAWRAQLKRIMETIGPDGRNMCRFND